MKTSHLHQSQIELLEEVDPQWAWQTIDDEASETWGARQARHLLVRSGFGTSKSEVERAIELGRTKSIEAVLFGRQDAEFEETLATLEAAVAPRRDIEGYVALWLHRMRHSPHPLLEKMTLFWHGHFATSAAKVTQSKLMLDQHQLLRKNALGRFSEMVLEISRDPAMLIYLDSTDNRKTHPNENYARELMELFCLGLGNYTENDIQEVARCFTGWEVRREKFRFNRYQHDTGAKSFFGSTGAFGGEEAVQIVLQQPAAARFIATKLMRFFMFDVDSIPTQLVEPLASSIRENNFDMQPVLRKLFSCQLFQSEHCYGRKIRSPIELTIGTLRSLDATTDLYQLAATLDRLGQKPFFPPNVKGWDGGTDWINSATMLERQNFVYDLTTSDKFKYEAGSLPDWIEEQKLRDANQVVDFLIDQFLIVAPSDEAKGALLELASQRDTDRDQRIKNTIAAIGSMPEFQLT